MKMISSGSKTTTAAQGIKCEGQTFTLWGAQIERIEKEIKKETPVLGSPRTGVIIMVAHAQDVVAAGATR